MPKNLLTSFVPQGQLTATTTMESDTTVQGGQDGRLETTGSPQSEPVYYQADYSQEYREEYGEEYREEGDEYQVYGETEDLQPISSHLIDLQVMHNEKNKKFHLI